MRTLWLAVAVVALGMAIAMPTLTIAATIGIDLGVRGDNLPSNAEIVRLLQTLKVTNVRIYDTDNPLLTAFVGSGIRVSVSVPNGDVGEVAASATAAVTWVRSQVQPFAAFVDRITVGNEWMSSYSDATRLVLAMDNIHKALASLSMGGIEVTTPHAFDAEGYPPSTGKFPDSRAAATKSILAFLARTGNPFMVNVYPYFAYIAHCCDSNPNYALLNAGASPITDGGLTYTNLFDAEVDTLISAMKRVGYGNVPIVIGETGWPSAGGTAASVENAKKYNNNLVRHALSNKGTPLRPGKNMPTYLFALFNENLKGGGIENNWGLYYPNKSPVYSVALSV